MALVSFRLLARTSNGSLRLAEDSRGLLFDLTLPPTSVGNDALGMVASHGWRLADADPS